MKATELYYFSTDLRKGETWDAVPAGKFVIELPSGLPVLKKTNLPPQTAFPPNALSEPAGKPCRFHFSAIWHNTCILNSKIFVHDWR